MLKTMCGQFWGIDRIGLPVSPIAGEKCHTKINREFLRCEENFAPYLVRSGKWPTAGLGPTLIRSRSDAHPLSGLPRRRRDPVPCCARIPRPAMRIAGCLFRLTAPANRTVSAPERWHVRRGVRNDQPDWMFTEPPSPIRVVHIPGSLTNGKSSPCTGRLESYGL